MTETQDRILEKLAKLRAHAESAAAIGSTAEAETFAAMFQKLLVDHKLEMSDVEFVNLDKEEPVDRHYIDYSQYPEVDIKSRRTAWIEDLAMIISHAHFCSILVHRNTSRITLVGRKTDCQVAEYMLMTLIRTADKLADQEYATFTTAAVKKCARCGRSKNDPSHPVAHEFKPNWAKARGFRPAFLKSFIQHLGARYRAEQSARSTGQALVRINQSHEAVKSWMTDNKIKTSSEISGYTAFNRHGVKRGREVADTVNLRADALTTETRKAIK